MYRFRYMRIYIHERSYNQFSYNTIEADIELHLIICEIKQYDECIEKNEDGITERLYKEHKVFLFLRIEHWTYRFSFCRMLLIS